MIRYQDYDKIVKEYFDITDDITRKTLISVNETEQNKVLDSLTSKLYDNIVNKVDDIDFGQIPESKGDITKVQNYEELIECLGVIRELLVEYRQPTKSVDIIIESVDNIRSRREEFEKGFRYNLEFPILIYCTICLSIYSATSLLIATCIEFIKSPSQENFDLMVDKVAVKKSSSNLLLQNLDRFNKSCRSGEMDKTLDYIIKSGIKRLTGLEPGIAIAGIALTGIILNIIPIMRELIYYFYYSRTQMSDYLEMQAELLELNAYNVEHNSDFNKTDRKTISSRQRGIAERLKKMSAFFQVNCKKAEKEASKEIANSNKKYKTDEIMKDTPDSTTSSLF